MMLQNLLRNMNKITHTLKHSKTDDRHEVSEPCLPKLRGCIFSLNNANIETIPLRADLDVKLQNRWLLAHPRMKFFCGKLFCRCSKVKKSSLKEKPQEAVEPSIISIPECSRYPLTRNWPSRNSLYEGSDLLNIPLGSFNVFIQPQGFHITSCPVKVKRVNSVWENKSFFMLSTVFIYWRRIHQQNLNTSNFQISVKWILWDGFV